MVDVWFINTAHIDAEALQKINHLLPNTMQEDIQRFRNHEDRRLKTMGRLLVREYFKRKHHQFNWNDWSLDERGKPFLKEKEQFNMSHSGDIVVVAFSDEKLGVDVEKHADFDSASVTSFFHKAEQHFIENAPNREEAFFTVWTRKEAYLKAKGVGIIEELHLESCLNESVGDNEKWFIRPISVAHNYTAALCTKFENPTIRLREFGLNEISEA